MDNALINATEKNDLKKVKCLIENGANINAETEKGVPVIIYAAAFGSGEIMKYLIDNGADVNAVNYEDQSVLQFAIASVYSSLEPDFVDTIRLLINKGFLLNGITIMCKYFSFIVYVNLFRNSNPRVQVSFNTNHRTRVTNSL